MRCLTFLIKQLYGLLFIVLGFSVSAAKLDISQKPLFTTNAVKPNLIMALDDSGSMDLEVLFNTNGGELRWDSFRQSVVNNGMLNKSGGRKFSYLFPNGLGIGKQQYDDSAVPPIEQYSFARSYLYNKTFYNPNVTYLPWVSNGSVIYSNIDPTAAPSDPVIGSSTIDLTLERASITYKFYFPNGMAIPAGVQLYGNKKWRKLSEERAVNVQGGGQSYAVKYFPATYYVPVADNKEGEENQTYKVGLQARVCDSHDLQAAYYAIYERNPSRLTGVDSLGPDGRCLQKVQITSDRNDYPHDGNRLDCADNANCTYTEELQNFANWYSYYRKRHLTLRGSMGQALNSITSIRVGNFTINKRTDDVVMRDLSIPDDVSALYDSLYSIVGERQGTPNRLALNYIGKQYQRKDSSAPILEACQQNYGLLFTDGYNNRFSNFRLLNDDGNAKPPYKDLANSNTLGDIAMHYYKTNLREDLKPFGQVPVTSACPTSTIDSLDCNTNLHMNTYAVGFGVKGELFGKNYHKVADAYQNYPIWPNTSRSDERQVDDLYHAAVNGRGEIYNASSPEELQAQLKSAFVDIQSKTGSASAVTFNTSTLEEDSVVYVTLFNSASWSGDIQAYALDGSGDFIADEDKEYLWSAAELLNKGEPVFSERKIVTYSGAQGIPFKWDKLNAAQQDDLKQVVSSSVTEQDVLDYLRGDRSNEAAGKLRVRESILGDIVSSSPVYVGKPNENWPAKAPFPTEDGQKFSDFKKAQSERKAVIYAGANDGMLHGFNAQNGREVIAYIPASVYSNETNKGLHYLADPLYSHRYYVDQTPTAASVYLDVTADSVVNPIWQTVLLGGLRAGGNSLFLLNITDPKEFSQSDENANTLALWEFSHPDLGNTFSQPLIAMMENGRWAAILGNGYNASGSGEASLFVVYLDGGLDGIWTDGNGGTDRDYIMINTGVGSAETPNGLATPAVLDLDKNGAADRVYAGDLKGNMWVFDLSDASTRDDPQVQPDWKIAYMEGAATPRPLFIAKDSETNAQPITTKPRVLRHPETVLRSSNTPNLIVMFGTGKYLEAADISNTSTQTFYGVWDSGVGDLGRDVLVQQRIGTVNMPNSSQSYRTLTNRAVNYSNKKGWYIDLPDVGERIIVNPVRRGKFVYFNTAVPSADACSAGGYGYLMVANIATGGASSLSAFDTNNDGKIDVSDSISGENPAGKKFTKGLPSSSRFLGNNSYTAGTDDRGGNNNSSNQNCKGSTCKEVVPGLAGLLTGRLSWQELKP
ncbi:pilus assembly protein [Aliamphritea ceti]|uniref:pilus assembly protein n=1 Tax=Aliamphritea ceti TaxID=1524258 RepID=UPI0021C38BFE|nr:PilC/PilY family type IV pilus protein [Aliamphritea ceti]